MVANGEIDKQRHNLTDGRNKPIGVNIQHLGQPLLINFISVVRAK